MPQTNFVQKNQQYFMFSNFFSKTVALMR